MIPLVFFVLSSLLLWLVIGAKGHWLFKAGVISFVLYFCISVGLSLGSLLGWPAGQPLPEEFKVHWIQIKEPNKRTGSEGSIYVWATSLGKYYKEDGWDGWRRMFVFFKNYDPTEPRAYRVNYSREMHERAEGALGKIMRGESVGGKNKGKGEGEGEGEGEDKGTGKNGGGKKGGGSLSKSDDIIFHELPPTKLPDKVTG